MIAFGVFAIIGAGATMVVHAEANVNKLALDRSAKPVTVIEVQAASFRGSRSYVGTIEPWVDLLYRLDVVSIEIPALRTRRADLPHLIEHFMPRALSRSARSAPLHFSRAAMEALSGYDWPGNVRELEHLIERLVLLCREDEVSLADLPRSLTQRRPELTEPNFGERVIPIRELQKRYASWALERFGGAKMATCEALGIDSKTLSKWLSADSL